MQTESTEEAEARAPPTRATTTKTKVAIPLAVNFLRALADAARGGGGATLRAQGATGTLILRRADGRSRVFSHLRVVTSNELSFEWTFGEEAPLYSAYASLRGLPEKSWWPPTLRVETSITDRVGLVWVESVPPNGVAAARGRVLLGAVGLDSR